ncbi:GDSL-type esterase/lipase family protein [Stieleria sp. TO1_6]|uniref:GDSL-type esterase/lipase family protein n=1 Tax=Stieleria tagensis TaxID=2956795 RepID=UPI00209B70B4|nr:GDSL-type esterase/lipase family protein [Stieleria tagensis]MCO8123506.1 GDSL-type esterase/lipase family protein [Stieleria tagensis]
MNRHPHSIGHINVVIGVAFSLLLLLFEVPAISQGDYPLRDAVECNPRGGVPNFSAKLLEKNDVKIAYLGGSITAAPGWRVQSRQWFQLQSPDVTVHEIPAAIGGTGSDLGVFRLQNDVLRHQPDLLFVEFAVNDGGAAPAQIQKAMEGIVRQAWRADSSLDICFVYTVSEPVMGDLRAGRMQRSASAMEEVADHYGIPSIHFGVKVAELEKAGKLVFQAAKPDNIQDFTPMVFSTDGVHPHVETGHQIYTQAIARSWPAILDASGEPQAHEVPEPLRADHWELARQIAIAPDMLIGDWQRLPADHSLAKRFSRNLPELYQAMAPGAALEFTFEGTTAAVFDLVGPDGGQVSVELDGGAPRTRNRIDGYCTYHRISKLAVATEMPNQRHTVRVILTPEQLDKRNILFERNRIDFDQHSDKYTAHTWYAGSLLILGQMIPNESK